MKTLSSILAWRIPWMEEPGRLQSMEPQRVRHDYVRHTHTHTVKGFSIVSEAEVDVFLEFTCFVYDPVDVDNLITGSCTFSISRLYISKFLFHILLTPSLKDFEHYLAS